MVFVKNDKCRKAFADAFKNAINSPSLIKKMPGIFKKATRVAQIMQKYGFDLAQAEFLYKNNNFSRYATWFQQGNGCKPLLATLPPELFLDISQHATGLNHNQTNKLWVMFDDFRSQAESKSKTQEKPEIEIMESSTSPRKG